MGALRRGLGPGELLKIELDREFERGRYVPSLPGTFDGEGIPVEDCEDILGDNTKSSNLGLKSRNPEPLES
jgi:hypothetical protein